MTNRTFFGMIAALAVLLLVTACSAESTQDQGTPPPADSGQEMEPQSPPDEKPEAGQIYLYGEEHSVEAILEKELELWHDYYYNENMRHLFIELPYYTGAYLNLWMQSDNDDILDAIFEDVAGTAGGTPLVKSFYQRLKADCPETIFHATDVGHQHETTGARYLQYLLDNGMEDSEEYLLTVEAIEQGENYYNNYEFYDHPYRENKMAENFIREFETLEGESIMGIYGGAHTGLEDMDYETATVPSMANQLAERYRDILHTESLRYLTIDTASMLTDPIRTDTIEVDGKEYTASYFGMEDLTGFRNFTHREFWRLEDAYEEFKDRPETGDQLPYNNYPMQLEVGQVFVIDLAMTDGTTMRLYYRSDGNDFEGMPSTEGFVVE